VRPRRPADVVGRPLSFTVRRVVTVASPHALPSCVLCFALLGLGSCGLNEAKSEAEALADGYFAASAAGDFDRVLSLYSDQAFAKTTREQFRGILVDVHTRCGAPKAHTLKAWNAFASTDGSSRVNLLYEVTYDGCLVSERLIVTKVEGKPARILGHHLNIDEVTSGKARGVTTA